MLAWAEIDMAKQRSHKRAEGMSQTTIALPLDLLNELDRIAESQVRSRNSLIHWMLREQVTVYHQQNKRAGGPSEKN